jgi:hypothetical protein
LWVAWGGEMKIAVDTQISKGVVNRLNNTGYEVVYRASTEPDEVWVPAALDRGATVFVSPDLDIPRILDRVGVDYKWIDVEQGLRSDKQYDYLVKRFKKLRQHVPRKELDLVELNRSVWQQLQGRRIPQNENEFMHLTTMFLGLLKEFEAKPTHNAVNLQSDHSLNYRLD